MKTQMKILFGVFLITLLAGCAATHTVLNKSQLSVQTQMSDTVFLDPVPVSQRTVYVQVKNTSGKNEFNIEHYIKSALTHKGYTVVHNPKQAHYWLQANVLHLDKVNLNEAQNLLDSGFGGGAFGALAAGTLGGNGHTMAKAGLAGAVIGMAADAMVKDNYYTLITDVQIQERLNGQQITETTRSHLPQGTSGTKTQSITTKTDYQRYQTRIISTANRVNLKIEEAAPELIAGLSQTLAGIF